MKAKVFILTLLFATYSINGVPQGIMEVHDSQSILQNALQFVKQWAEMVEQGADQAEQLQLELDAETRRIKAVKEEMEDIIKMTRKVLVLYREIDRCNSSLENLRKNLLRSNYMSVEEKYTIYSYAQNLCYDIVKRRSDIEEMVKDCQTYSENKKSQEKKVKIEEVTDVVRQVRKSIESMERMSVELISFKRKAIEQDYMIRKCFSLKLY
ncbi:MAG: hypothetical protein MJZ11_10555 [Lachnospiraceae bacterium]|nr:hypothetical protein [Lachnospiraceae bacterium]